MPSFERMVMALGAILAAVLVFAVLSRAFFLQSTFLQSTSDVLLSEARSPDGKWSVHVYWHHVSRTPSCDVKFDLVVREGDEIVLRREIGQAEVYRDIANEFSPVICENDHAKVGKYRFEKAELMPLNRWGFDTKY